MSEYREFKYVMAIEESSSGSWSRETFNPRLDLIEKRALDDLQKKYDELNDKLHRTTIALNMCRDAYDILKESTEG